MYNGVLCLWIWAVLSLVTFKLLNLKSKKVVCDNPLGYIKVVNIVPNGN